MSSDFEATTGWLEPLAQKIKDNPKTIVIPSIDGIDDRTIAFHGSVVSFYFFRAALVLTYNIFRISFIVIVANKYLTEKIGRIPTNNY